MSRCIIRTAMSGLHYKKDGSLDMRYSSSKEAMSSSEGCGSSSSGYSSFSGLSYSSHSSSSGSVLHYKKDGSLDMRYSSSREAMSSGGKYGSSSSGYSRFSGPSYSSHSPSSGSGIHYKEDEFFDTRFSSEEETMSSDGWYGSSSSGYYGFSGSSCRSRSSSSGSGLHYKKDGSLDMRYSSSREAMSSDGKYGSSSSGYSCFSGPSYGSHSTSSGSGINYEEDGSFDTRFSSSEETMSSDGWYGSSSSSYYGFSGSCRSRSSSSGSGLHYKKDGSLDMRYSSSRQAMSSGEKYGSSSSGYSCFSGPSYSSHSSTSGSVLHYKKDGSLDMRYTSSREAMSSGGKYGSSSSGYSRFSGPSYSSHSASSGSGLHYKKDGSLDMRYSSSKQAAASGVGSGYGSASSYSSGGASGIHYKKDGTLDTRYSSSKKAASLSANFNQMKDLHYKKGGSPDMRNRSSKQEVHGISSGSKPAVQQKFYGIPLYVPKKKDGTPDMRTTVAKNWVASEASACMTTALPAWVPRKKDGSVDLGTAIGRAFANHGSPKVQQREQYWHSRLADDLFYRLVQSQRQISVPALEPTPVRETPFLYDECCGRFSEDFEASIPDSIPHIDYCNLTISADESSELGRGSFGVVLKGKWNGIDLAVKKLHMDKLTKKEKNAFRKEVVILANLGSHPNLVKLYGYCLNSPCIVMELVPRGSLSYLLHYCEDPEVEAKMTDGRIKKNLVIGIVDGMRQLHASQIVHGDLKPQNVLVTTDYMAKITDFGLSRLQGKTSSTVASRQLGENDEEIASVAGTAGYMAPELLDSTAPPDYSSDVFSFGVILNEVICEEEPYSDQYANFAGRGPFGAANYAKQGKRPTISYSTPPVVKRLIEKCWAAEPRARPSFEELLDLIIPATFKIPDSINCITKNLAIGTVDGMRQLYASQIVHGDLKPQNPLVTTECGVSSIGLRSTSSNVGIQSEGAIIKVWVGLVLVLLVFCWWEVA